MASFQARVHQYLRDNGLTLTEVAKKMSYPLSSLSQKVKTGRIPRELQKPLAAALMVEMETLKKWGIVTANRGPALAVLEEELWVTAQDLEMLTKMHTVTGDMTIDFIASVIKERRYKEQKNTSS